jgi:hypothetical protein
MPTKGLFTIAWAVLSGVIYWLLDHFLYSWLVQYLGVTFDIKEANVIASVSSYVIPAFLSAVIIWAVYQAGRRWQPAPRLAATSDLAVAPASALIGSQLQIEFGNDERYERTEHIDETGIFRRTIYISVFNGSLDDISDCNIRLIAVTPRPNTGNNPTNFPVGFGANFDLRGKQRKFIQIIRFAENPGNASILERDNIIILAASGGFFPGWTTLPIPSRDTPAILTLEAFAPGITPRTAHLHIWVIQRRIHAQII